MTTPNKTEITPIIPFSKKETSINTEITPIPLFKKVTPNNTEITPIPLSKKEKIVNTPNPKKDGNVSFEEELDKSVEFHKLRRNYDEKLEHSLMKQVESETRAKQLEIENKVANARNSFLAKHLNVSEQKVVSLNAQYRELEMAVEQVKREREQLETSIVQVTGEKETISETLRMLETQKREISGRCELQMKNTTINLKAQLHQQQQQISFYDQREKDLNREKMGLQKKIEELSSNLQHLEFLHRDLTNASKSEKEKKEEHNSFKIELLNAIKQIENQSSVSVNNFKGLDLLGGVSIILFLCFIIYYLLVNKTSYSVPICYPRCYDPSVV